MNEIVVRPAISYGLVKVLPLILAAVLFLGLAWWLLAAFVLVAVMVMAFAFFRLLQIRLTYFTLNDEVLLISTGVLLRRTDHLELYRVKDYVVIEPLWMRVLGLMTLELMTTDLTGRVTVLRGIPKSDMAEVIRERVQAARHHNPIVELN